MEKGMITTLAGIISIVACVALVKKIKADIEELKKDRPTERFKMTDEQLEGLRNAIHVKRIEQEAEQEAVNQSLEKIDRLK